MLDGVLSVGATAPVNQQNFDMLASYTNFGSEGSERRSRPAATSSRAAIRTAWT